MILRKLTQALREQNWTAIVIEFVLLVAGVFINVWGISTEVVDGMQTLGHGKP